LVPVVEEGVAPGHLSRWLGWVLYPRLSVEWFRRGDLILRSHTANSDRALSTMSLLRVVDDVTGSE